MHSALAVEQSTHRSLVLGDEVFRGNGTERRGTGSQSEQIQMFIRPIPRRGELGDRVTRVRPALRNKMQPAGAVEPE
jgi:hypothetical protein